MDLSLLLTGVAAFAGALGGIKAGLNGLGKRLGRVETKQDLLNEVVVEHEGRLSAAETELELGRAG